MENKYDKKYQDFISKKQMESLKDEFRAKPFFEVWKTTYYTTIAFKTLLQAISVLTFVCAVAYFFWLFTGSILLGVTIGVSLSILIEYNKNIAYENAFRKKLQFGTSGKASIAFILLTSSISISLSYFGAPKFVEVATPKPALEDVELYEKQMSVKADSITNFWESQAQQNEKKAKQIHDNNNWKGTTTKAVRPLIVALTEKSTSNKDSMYNALSIHSTRVQNHVSQMEENNKRTLATHNQFLKDFGMYAALVTLIIEVLILLSVYWTIYYKFRSYKELVEEKTISSLKAKTVPKEPIKTDHTPAPPPPGKEETKKKLKPKSNCLYCGDEFTVNRNGQKYCSKRVHPNGQKCRIMAYYERRKKQV